VPGCGVEEQGGGVTGNQRLAPLSQYRVIYGDDWPTIEYMDDRESAQRLAADVGGEIECYVFRIGWVKWCESMIEKQ